MIEARAIVRGVDAGSVRVQALNPGNCPRCAEGKGCGGGILSRLVSQKRPDIVIQGPHPELSAGEMVVLGLEEQALLEASVWVYLVPLSLMLVAAGVADAILGAPDLIVMLFAVAGLMLGLKWLTRRAQTAGVEARFRPVILRKESTNNEHCARMT